MSIYIHYALTDCQIETTPGAMKEFLYVGLFNHGLSDSIILLHKLKLRIFQDHLKKKIKFRSPMEKGRIEFSIGT